MAVFSKPKRNDNQRRTALKGVPVLRDGAAIRRTDDGGAEITVSVPRGPAFFDRFRPPVIEKRHVLDELGAFVLQQIDGRRNVEQIIDAFVERFRINPREAELSTVAFVKMLLQRQVITVVTGSS